MTKPAPSLSVSNDQAARFGNAADDLKLILVIEDTKAAGFEDYRVDYT